MRLAIDWTIEGTQHLLVVSRVTGGRAVPIYWRAYDGAVLKGRRRRYEMAVIRRVLRRVQRAIGRRRVLVTADRGFAEVALGAAQSCRSVTQGLPSPHRPEYPRAPS